MKLIFRNIVNMNVKEKFLELTSRTYPHGSEGDVFPLLNSKLEKDEFGNFFINIGKSDTMFTCHIDTATSMSSGVVHVIKDNIIETDGKTILGADDKAGATIMLYMIENNVPGLYYFFVGEEVGCVGSKKVAHNHRENKSSSIKKVVSFDRKGIDSIITFQSSRRCCSDKFAEELANELNQVEPTFKYKSDPTGSVTDSIQFLSIYPECTNISVGFRYEHTFNEIQDIDHLEKLAKACVRVRWSKLPVSRDPSKDEYKSYSIYDDDYEYNPYSYAYNSGGRSESRSRSFYNNTVYFHDKKYGYSSSIETDAFTSKIKAVKLCDRRIEYERMLIRDLLDNLEMQYKGFKWNGFKLEVSYLPSKSEFERYSICDRNDLLEYLPELDYTNMIR